MIQTEYSFQIIGTKFINGAYEACLNAKGRPIILKAEPDNAYDPYAIAAYLDDGKVGYVPNSGFSCGICYAPIDPKYYHCRECGANGEDLVKGGLAFRLNKRNVLNMNHGCVVLDVNTMSKAAPLKVKLIVSDVPDYWTSI